MTYELIFDALADGTRRRIFELVRRQPQAVGQLAARLPVSQPAVSQHLRVLREAGLVQARRDGRRRIYAPRPDGLAPLRAYVEAMWDDALEGFTAAAHGKAKAGARGAAKNDRGNAKTARRRAPAAAHRTGPGG